jgi:hypothetical protein
MSRMFATASGFRVVLGWITLTILAGAATVHAQQTPEPSSSTTQQPAAQQPPANQQPSSQPSGNQEASPEEIGPVRKPKPKDYKNWTFNVGGGASLTNGATGNFVRGGGGIAAAGIARNTSKYFGLRFDFQWDNLPLRTSALEAAQALHGTSHVYSFNLDPILNIPVTKVWGGYIVAGGSFFHRSGKLDSSTAIPGSACNAFFNWWGNCFNASLPLNKNFISTSQNEFGENFGFGLTRKIRPNIEIYGEFRYLHGTHSGVTTDLRPITVGVRW